MKAKFLNENISDKLVSKSFDEILNYIIETHNLDIKSKNFKKFKKFLYELNNNNINFKISNNFRLNEFLNDNKTFNELLKAYEYLKTHKYTIKYLYNRIFYLSTYIIEHKKYKDTIQVYNLSEAEKLLKNINNSPTSRNFYIKESNDYHRLSYDSVINLFEKGDEDFILNN